MGLALLIPAWAAAQAGDANATGLLNPQLNWVRSMRPSLAPAAVPEAVQTSEGKQAKPTALSDGAHRAAKDVVTQKWAILMADKTLYRTFRRWSQEAQYQLLWQVDRDYPIEAEVAFESTLREAVAQVMSGVALTDFPLQAIFNPSTRVLRVIRHLDDDRR